MVSVTAWSLRLGAVAGQRAGAAGDEGAVGGAEPGRAVEGERGLAAVEGDERLGEQRRRARSGRRRGRGRRRPRSARTPTAGEEVEPVHGEVVEDEIVDRLEGRAGDPAVVPVDRRCRRDCTSPIRPARTASRIQARCGAQRPFWLTASRTPLRVGEVAEPRAGVEVDHEGLLRQHVLAGRERRLDHRQPLGRDAG